MLDRMPVTIGEISSSKLSTPTKNVFPKLMLSVETSNGFGFDSSKYWFTVATKLSSDGSFTLSAIKWSSPPTAANPESSLKLRPAPPAASLAVTVADTCLITSDIMLHP